MIRLILTILYLVKTFEGISLVIKGNPRYFFWNCFIGWPLNPIDIRDRMWTFKQVSGLVATRLEILGVLVA